MDKRDRSVEEILKDIEKEGRTMRDEQLANAYAESPEAYNQLFDEFQRVERETRKEEGTYTIDDMLDDLEDRRERLENPRTR